MEKSRCLEEVSTLLHLFRARYPDILGAIKRAARRTARSSESFENTEDGWIRIRIEPLCKAAAAWLDGCAENDVDFEDFGLREYVYKMYPSNTTSQAHEQAESVSVDETRRGTIAAIATYKTVDGQQIADVFRITVCVSGATPADEEACALAGINAAAGVWRDFCRNTNGFTRQF